jgi:hypothetical protein
VIDRTETDDESLIGEECHIVARQDDGPRGDPNFPEEKRDRYANLVLLCATHHKMVDDQPGTYTPDALRELKSTHESWVKESLTTYDPKKQRDDECYADIVEEFSGRVRLDEWRDWTYSILTHGQPQLSKTMDESLRDTRDWILSRVWPGRYEEIEAALTNFRLVLQDFQNTFHDNSEETPNGFITKKFYHLDRYDPEEYDRLGDLHTFHCRLVEDLMLELTRAANYVCDKVREHLFAAFRRKEGVVLVERGPFMNLSYHIYRTEYRGPERVATPYRGLEDFKRVRHSRDVAIGYGSSPDEEKEYERNAHDAAQDGESAGAPSPPVS